MNRKKDGPIKTIASKFGGFFKFFSGKGECEVCGAPIDSADGQYRRFCSRRCRALRNNPTGKQALRYANRRQ